MNAYKIILVAFVSVAAFAGCAKKDNSFASKYAKNAMGATAANPDIVGQAFESAGFTMDIVYIHTVTRGLPSANSVFASTILLDESSQQVQTAITPGNINGFATGQTTISGKKVTVAAKCANTDCNPYYIVATAYLNDVAKLQVGYKFYSLESTADRDKYQALGPGQISTPENMINALN